MQSVEYSTKTTRPLHPFDIGIASIEEKGCGKKTFANACCDKTVVNCLNFGKILE
jgi:hypothetical protein